MPQQSHPVRNGIICACVPAVLLLVSWPVAEMGFVDDWSYVKTALVFARTGHIVYNGWATAMLGWAIPWAALFIKPATSTRTGKREHLPGLRSFNGAAVT